MPETKPPAGLRWPAVPTTPCAWRGLNGDEAVVHAGPHHVQLINGAGLKARCGTELFAPLAWPAANQDNVGNIIPFEAARTRLPVYPGDIEPRRPCPTCCAAVQPVPA